MRAAFYESDITPPLGGFMWGYYSRQIAVNVHDKLFAKAVVIEDNGQFAAIVCVDTCCIPAEMHKIVTDRIYEYTGIPYTNVCICSNHTHRGAPVSDAPEINCFSDDAYKDVFYRIVADTVTLAHKRLVDVDARFGTVEVENISFNRNFILEDGRLVTHGRGRKNIKENLAGTDTELSALTFECDGKPIGAVINYSLHQDTTGGIDGYSGDYSSILAKELKKKYGDDFVSLFVLGTCGDINHINPKDNIVRNHHKEIGVVLAEKTIEAIKSSNPVTGGLGVMKSLVKVKKRTIDKEKTKKEIDRLLKTDQELLRIRNLLYYSSVNDEEYGELYVMGIRIGDTMIHILPGEVFVNVGLSLKKSSPFKNNMVIENANSYCGYIPTKVAFDENSDLYESTLCFHSCYVAEACDILYDEAHKIAENLHKSE